MYALHCTVLWMVDLTGLCAGVGVCSEGTRGKRLPTSRTRAAGTKARGELQAATMIMAAGTMRTATRRRRTGRRSGRCASTPSCCRAWVRTHAPIALSAVYAPNSGVRALQGTWTRRRTCCCGPWTWYAQEGGAALLVFSRAALTQDPVDVDTLAAYAVFLHRRRGELGRAEGFFRRALQTCLPGLLPDPGAGAVVGHARSPQPAARPAPPAETGRSAASIPPLPSIL